MGAARDAEQEREQDEAGMAGAPGASPWNLMIKHRLVQRRGRRSQVMSSFTDPVVSMDLLRAVLQPSINEEIQAVFGKYMKFFQKAAGNVRENVGEEVDTEQLIQETCRSCLEQAKLLFCDGKKSVARLPHEVPVMKRIRPVEEELSQQGSPIPRKAGLSHLLSWQVEKQGLRAPAEGWPQGRSVGEAALTTLLFLLHLALQWDPLRITDSSAFVLGSRANKALGMGGDQRPPLHQAPSSVQGVAAQGQCVGPSPTAALLPPTQYAADPQDKHWLAEQQHMRATGGKMAYLLLEEDIQDLAASDEYRGSLDLRLDELKPFVPPPWMTSKMRKYMETLRSEGEQPSPEGAPDP
ncbi:hypothetical protein lerEdw1_005037 [Lerista edwardsae]|nr:hypothetical protein lerEdw1_005037 [Lerista edwardsae]